MKPRKSPNHHAQASMFRVELAALVDGRHRLTRLVGEVDWEPLEAEVAECFCGGNGAPAKPTRLMVGLHYLKSAYGLSDEQTVRRWVENPYWQYFCGSKYFEYTLPVHPSLMTRWRALLGEGGMERLLEKAIPRESNTAENGSCPEKDTGAMS